MYQRDPNSHIREDGVAKISFYTREVAAVEANRLWQRTGKPHAPYLCSQRPDHWHIGAGLSNLETSP